MHRRQAVAALLAAPLAGWRAVSALQISDLTALSIAQAAARLAKRAFTPLELTNAYLARIDKLNKELNAYITVTYDVARRQARGADANGPLNGIPIGHKDLFETRGVRTTAGSMLFENHMPETNAAIVQLLENAGAVLLGKTNTHELGGGVSTINPFFGTTRNPIDRIRIAGGSSGGSAAAVVAQLCAAATGSDTGGSVRIPAAFCGCVGFKPTHGRISTQGLLAASPTFDHVGFLTRTVEDAEILFDVAMGTGNSRLAVPPPAMRTSPATVRVGVARNYFFDGLEPRVAGGIEAALNAMRVNATVADITYPADSNTMSRVFDPVFMFELWHRFGADWRTNPGLFSKEFSAVFAFERPTVAEYETALAALKEYQAAVDRLFDTVDVIVTPTVPVTAPPIAGPIDGMRILRNTWPFNAAGAPAISVPVRSSATQTAKTDLPVGLQLIARRGEDDKLLQVTRRLAHP